MPKRVFAKDFLKEELGLPYDGDDGTEITIVEQDRWSVVKEIVFPYDGKWYKTDFSEGATEYQEEYAWEHEDTVTCYEVEQREVLVKKWVNVDDPVC